MNSLHLVDSSIYIFRAYFSLPESLVDVDGQAANAVRGYANFICQLKQAADSEHFVFAFDESLTTSFRNEIYPAYKANRELPPENLASQLLACRRLTEILGFKTYVNSRFEADDLIGTVAHKMRAKDYKMRYITGDKDLAQLVRPGDQWWNFANNEKLGRKQIKIHMGVWPEQVVDLLALMGDAVDNIPGVPGVGAKTAVHLLNKFRHLEGVYQQLHKIPATGLRGAKRIQELLGQHRDQALLSQQLARISESAPIRCTEGSLIKKRVKKGQLVAFCDQHNFGERMLSRLLAV